MIQSHSTWTQAWYETYHKILHVFIESLARLIKEYKSSDERNSEKQTVTNVIIKDFIAINNKL
jgi:hypothetical protein